MEVGLLHTLKLNSLSSLFLLIPATKKAQIKTYKKVPNLSQLKFKPKRMRV
jgi:hypothetical protein